MGLRRWFVNVGRAAIAGPYRARTLLCFSKWLSLEPLGTAAALVKRTRFGLDSPTAHASDQSASLVDHRALDVGRDRKFSRAKLAGDCQAHALGRTRADRSAVLAHPHLLSAGADLAADL